MRRLLNYLLLFIPITTFSQVDFSRYLDENSLPIINPNDFIEIQFKWSMPGNIQVFMNEGLNSLLEKKPSQAVENFTEIIKLDSTFWIAYYYRGVAFKNLYKFDQSKNDLVKAKILNAKRAEISFELGEVFQLKSEFDKAINEYEKAIEIDPTLVQSHHSLGNMALLKGDLRKATKYYEKCNEIDPSFPDAFFMRGVLTFKVKKNDTQSIIYFNKALEANPNYSAAYLWRGLANLSLNQPQESIKDWNKLVQLNPSATFPLMMRGFLSIELGNYDQAFVDFKKIFLTNETHEDKFIGGQTILDKKIDLQFALQYLIRNGYGLNELAFGYMKKGFCLLLAGKGDQALQYMSMAQQVEPSALAIFLKALTFEHTAKHDSAYAYYEKALRLDNNIFDAHKKRSIYRYNLKDWRGAYADFDEMIRIQPETMVTYRLRGLVKINAKDYYGAIIDFTKFLKSDTLDHEVWLQRGIARQEVGDKKGATEDFTKTLQLHPKGNEQLFELVAKQYLESQDTASAIYILKLYRDFDPIEASAHIELGLIYADMGKWKDVQSELDIIDKNLQSLIFMRNSVSSNLSLLRAADENHLGKQKDCLKDLDKSLKFNPNNQKARYLRGQIYLREKDFKKALSDFKILKQAKFRDSESIYENLIKEIK